jgi:transcription antitermination protein NusB
MTTQLTKQQRQAARRLALQGLYQMDIQRSPVDVGIAEMIAPLIAEAELDGPAAEHARMLVGGAWLAATRYDQMIGEASRHWDVSRMPTVDRNILRLALHELIECLDVPARIVIDEAIEMGREFGSADTPQFINGVLDAIWKNHDTLKIARASEKAREESRKPPEAAS